MVLQLKWSLPCSAADWEEARAEYDAGDEGGEVVCHVQRYEPARYQH